MNKILLCGTLLAASAILVSACSGDDDDDGGAVLTNGTYTFDGSLTEDTCGFGNGFYETGGTADITVTATVVSVDFGGAGDPYDYAISGTSLHDDAGSGDVQIACTGTDADGDYNCGSRSYNCTVTRGFDYGGQITGNDAFTLNDEYTYSATGADCAIVSTSAGIPFPCTTVDSGTFTK